MRRNKANAKLSLKNKQDRTKKDKDRRSPDSDTTDVVNVFDGSCELIKMVFFKTEKIKRHQTDTFLVHFSIPENEIDELSQVQIRGYLLKNDNDHLIKIKLCYCSTEEKENELSRALYLQRTKKLTRFLNEKKIPKRKIELE
jgi:hypothetical protein